MSTHTDMSTPDQPGEVWAVDTLDGPAITRADRWILADAEFVTRLPRRPTAHSFEVGTDGHGLGVVRYQRVRQVDEHIDLYERVTT